MAGGESMSGADEKIRAVLKVTADDVAGWLLATGSLERVYADDTNTIESVLIKHLLPILLAGQAMRDDFDIQIALEDEQLSAWDDALAAAQDQPEKESGR